MSSMNFAFSSSDCNSCRSWTVCFEVVGSGVFRATKEYTLTYVPETNEWFGDVIAYGQWRDLEADEVLQLREVYNLDVLMQDYLERGEDQVTYDYYAAAK